MNKQQENRAKILLKATHEILTKCNEAAYVQNVMSVTAIWDEVECDGNCLMEEIGELIEEMGI